MVRIEEIAKALVALQRALGALPLGFEAQAAALESAMYDIMLEGLRACTGSPSAWTTALQAAQRAAASNFDRPKKGEII